MFLLDLGLVIVEDHSNVQYLWSGPATNDNWSNRISLHNIQFSEAGEYKCSATLHNSSITAGIPVVLQCK